MSAPIVLPPAGPPQSPLPPAQAAALWAAAKRFEGMAIGALLAPIFATDHSARGAFGGGNAEATWKPMLVNAIGRQIAAAGGLGLAAPVFAALLAAQETKPHDGPQRSPGRPR